MDHNIYKIECDIELLLDSMYDSQTGEVKEDVYEQFQKLMYEKDKIREQLILYYLNEKAFQVGIKAEIVRLNEKIDKSKKIQDSLFNQIQSMTPTDTKIKTELFELGYRKTESVHLHDNFVIDDLDSDCVRVRMEPDKAEIKKKLKRGIMIPGVSIKTENKMRIK